MEAAQVQAREVGVADNRTGLVESGKNNTYDAAADGVGLSTNVIGGVDEDLLGGEGSGPSKEWRICLLVA